MSKRISELVKLAKGEQRSWRQFAAECGVGSSTMYRLSNDEIRRNISDATLQAIASHSVDDTVTVKALAEACGNMVGKSRVSTSQVMRITALEHDARHVVQDLLLTSGAKVSILPSRDPAQFYDFAYSADCGGTEYKIFCEVKAHIVSSQVYSYIGQVLSKGDCSDNSWHLLIAISNNDRWKLISHDIRKNFSDVRVSANIAVLCMHRDESSLGYAVDEILLTDKVPPVLFQTGSAEMF